MIKKVLFSLATMCLLAGCGVGPAPVSSSKSVSSVTPSSSVSSVVPSSESSIVSSSSVESSSVESSSVVSSSQSSSTQSSSTTVQGIVGTVAANSILSSGSYQTKDVDVTIGKAKVTFGVDDVAYRAADKNISVECLQFAKASHATHSSKLNIKNTAIHIVKITVYGFDLTTDEEGISISATGISFAKSATEVTGTQSGANYVITFTADKVVEGTDYLITNASDGNARYISQFEFVA